MTKSLVIANVSLENNEDQDPDYPYFLVQGQYDGEAFSVSVGTDLQSTDADFVPVSGPEFYYEEPETQQAVFEALYASDPYKQAKQEAGVE